MLGVSWYLENGGHSAPKANGGTCINEAALVAAGFEHKQVGSSRNLPPCFSRPLAQLGIALNDMMPDVIRQELLPVALMLSGSADNPAVEQHRADYAILETIRQTLTVLLPELGFADQVPCVGRLETVSAAIAFMDTAIGKITPTVTSGNHDLTLIKRLKIVIAETQNIGFSGPDEYVGHLGAFFNSVRSYGHSTKAGAEKANLVWRGAMAAYKSAFEIGNKAAPLDTALVARRFEEAKAKAAGFRGSEF